MEDLKALKLKRNTDYILFYNVNTIRMSEMKDRLARMFTDKSIRVQAIPVEGDVTTAAQLIKLPKKDGKS